MSCAGWREGCSAVPCALGQLGPRRCCPPCVTFRTNSDHIKEGAARRPASDAGAFAASAPVPPVDVPAYLSLIAQGRYAEALSVHRDANPFALICGRVCPAFCEKRCRRGDIDEPIAIRQAKRYMADRLFDVPREPPRWRLRRTSRWRS
jgi:NADH-quinone oxidoreductase subunit F